MYKSAKAKAEIHNLKDRMLIVKTPHYFGHLIKKKDKISICTRIL